MNVRVSLERVSWRRSGDRSRRQLANKMSVITAPAKINPHLHITAKRQDGYHLLDSSVVFLELSDELEITDTGETQTIFTGEFAGYVDAQNNSVLNILKKTNANKKVTITKNIPVGAGLGGGSADAAAILRYLVKENIIDEASVQQLAQETGADVWACYQSRPLIMRGIGDETSRMNEQLINELHGKEILLINPRKHSSTPQVYGNFAGDFSFTINPTSIADLANAHNDLEKPAIKTCPEIAEILEFLQNENPLFARMSGSGSTCFAIFDDASDALTKAKDKWPDYWVKSTRLYNSELRE